MLQKMPLLPGEILKQRYRIVHVLAEGSYGVVYRARDMVIQKDVVIKEYLDASIEIQRRFRKEARRLSQLDHPQLPRVLDHFAVDGVGQYLVSDFIDGVDLQQLMAQYGRLPSDLIVNWLQEIAAPLTYLHSNDQLHLNIKPANIRLTPDGALFLVNTGLPGLGIRPRASGYGAPEQQTQQAVSIATDIYSLGGTLYTLLTGEVPPLALSRESGLDDLKPAREVNPTVEPYLSLVAARALELRPDTRYESVAEFANALKRSSGQQPLAPPMERRRSVSQLGQPVKPLLPLRQRRHIERRALFGLLGILSIVVALGATLLLTNRPSDTSNDAAQTDATATSASAIVAAATQLAPTETPVPFPSQTPVPTPEPIITDSGARMVFIPGGIFRMGNDSGEPNSAPSHLVNMSPYFIDETEVTNRQYALCVADGACSPPARPGATYHEAYFGDEAYDEYPVIFVSWYDAEVFCEWRGARLPSEAEWEMAAGFDPEQTVVFRFPWGDAFDGEKANFCDANCPMERADPSYNDGHRDTAPVGSYTNGRSPAGLYDMAGNVLEWVADWYDPRYYESSTDTNPLGPPEGDFKTIRGGSWLSSAETLAVYARNSYDPTVARANLGFRCAMDAN